MGYFLTIEPTNAVPPKSWVPPKTHTPASPVKERGHRYYSQETGRWASRDPMWERSGLLLFGMVRNNTIRGIDPLGLSAPGDPDYRTPKNPTPSDPNYPDPPGGKIPTGPPPTSPPSIPPGSPGGYKPDPGLAKAARCMCRIPLARAHMIASYCSQCQQNCRTWCLNEWLTNNYDNAWLQTCNADCAARAAKCMLSGCSLTF
jgi:RHS repeat-associated protein